MQVDIPFDLRNNWAVSVWRWFQSIQGIVTKTAAYTVEENVGHVRVDCTGGAITITIPLALTRDGRRITVTKVDSSANAVTVARSGSDTFNGATTLSLPLQYNSVTIISNGVTAWERVGYSTPVVPSGTNTGDVTLAGTPDYITISGQVITRAQIDLATDVSGQLPLANGGTGANLSDPGADRIVFWDDSAGAVTWLTAGSGLTISDTEITASGSSGGITTIESGSIGTGATKDITSIPATYSYLILQLNGLSSDTATRQPLVQVDTDNGASFDATAGNYEAFRITSTPSLVAATLASLIEGNARAATVTFTWTIYIYGYHGGPNMWWRAKGADSAPASYWGHFGTYIGSTSAINALRVLWNGSGNFDAGTYALYGVS